MDWGSDSIPFDSYSNSFFLYKYCSCLGRLFWWVDSTSHILFSVINTDHKNLSVSRQLFEHTQKSTSEVSYFISISSIYSTTSLTSVHKIIPLGITTTYCMSHSNALGRHQSIVMMSHLGPCIPHLQKVPPRDGPRRHPAAAFEATSYFQSN